MDIRKAIQIIRNSILPPSQATPDAPSMPTAAPAESDRPEFDRPKLDRPKFDRHRVLAELEKVSRRAVLLRRTGLPVPGSHEARSFIGGLPRLPAHLAWPEDPSSEEPYAFMFAAQIDLAELPLEDSPLPRSGTLYFFFCNSKEWVEEHEVRVLYHEGAGNEFSEREPPPSLGACFNHSWRPQNEALDPRIGLKYPIRFVPFISYRSYLGAAWNDRSVQQPTGQEFEELRIKEFDTRLAHELEPPAPGLHEAIRSAGASWAFAWGVIGHSARALSQSIDELLRRKHPLRDKSPEALAELKRIQEQADHWVQRAASHSLTEPCDEPTQQLFNSAWMAFASVIQPFRIYTCEPDQLRSGAVRAVCVICASLSAEALAMVPEPIQRAIEAEARWKRPVHSWGHNPIHQMLGYGDCVQNAAYDRIDEVMLLQLQGDENFGWHSNIGCSLQFWISPDALAKRDFEAVQVSFECD